MAREGSLEAPTRHPLGQDTSEFWNEESLFSELERVFDICHGCRRCVSLCGSFPTLFDLMGLRWAPHVVELDHVALLDSAHIVRGRQRSISDFVIDEAQERVDGFLGIREKHLALSP